jgi:hypothetical protein
MDSPAAFVDIGVTGGEPSRSCQFFINGVQRGQFPLDIVGDGTLLYIVPAGPQRNALADLGHADGSWETVDGINLVFLEGDGDSMALRYAP